MTASASNLIEVDGATLFVEVSGAGRVLVLIHAGIADSRMWDEQIEVFTREFQVIRYDLRGFGRSSIPPSPYAHHDDLRTLLQALDIPSAVILGASFGGNVATAFTLQNPEMVEGLILVGSRVANATPFPELRAGWDAVDAVYETGDTAGAVELELQMWVDGPRRPPEAVSPSVRERVREMNTAIFARFDEQEAAAELELEPPAHGRLAEIRVPTLVIVGSYDQPDVLASGDAIAGTIPGARLATIADAAHLPSMERPQEFNRLVLEFIRALPS